MSKLQFCVILTEEQQEACNSFLHTPKDYAWLPDNVVYFDNLRDYTGVMDHVLMVLRESGWDVHKWYLVETPDPMTMDLTYLSKDKEN